MTARPGKKTRPKYTKIQVGKKWVLANSVGADFSTLLTFDDRGELDTVIHLIAEPSSGQGDETWTMLLGPKTTRGDRRAHLCRSRIGEDAFRAVAVGVEADVKLILDQMSPNRRRTAA